MKKLLTISALALTLTVLAAPRASAWANFNFGVGLNLSYQSGNNRWLWGALRNGPVGTEGYNWAYSPSQWGPWEPGLAPSAPGYGSNPAFLGGPHAGFDPSFAGAPAYGAAPAPSWVAPPPAQQLPPAKKDNKNDNDQVRTSSWSYYQPTSYPQTAYPAAGYNYGGYTPNYSYGQTYPSGGYYPYTGGYYGPAPSYWQGR